MKNLTSFIFIFISFTAPLHSQKCEDLPTLIAQAKNDTNKVLLLWRWAGCFTGSNPDSVVSICKQGSDLAKKLNYTEGVFRCNARPTPSLMRLGRIEEAQSNLAYCAELAKNIRDTFNILRFKEAYCLFYAQQYLTEKIVETAKEGLRISIENNETYRRHAFYMSLATAYTMKGDAKKAIENYFTAIPLAEKADDKPSAVKAYGNIGIIYQNNEYDWNDCFKYTQLALKGALEINDQFTVMTSYSIISDYYTKFKHDTILGIKNAEQALVIARRMNLPREIATYTRDLGKCYANLNDFDKALSYLEEAVKILETLPPQQNGDILSSTLMNLGEVYYLKKDYLKAIQIQEKYIQNKPFGAIVTNEVHIYQFLADANAKIGNHEKAYNYFMRYKELKDSLMTSDNIVKVKNLEAKYELGKKEDEVKLLNQERALVTANLSKQEAESQRQRLLAEQQRLLAQSTETARQLLERENQLKDFELRDQADSLNYQQLQVNFEKKDKAQKLAEAALLQEGEATKRRWAIGIMSGLLLLSGIGFYAWRVRQKAISDKKLAESELKALRSQLNPHFLFNSMNAINSYILDNDRLKASEYLAQFAGVMRGILETSRNTTVSLEKELEWLENYIQIEQKRFSKPFDYQINVDTTIDTYSTQVPAMLLQPFVENAIWHGFLHKPTKGHLTIDVKQQNKQLTFTIEDDGIGRQKAATFATKRDNQQSLGVKISEERLQLINSSLDKNNIQIKDLVNAEGVAGGTQVVISVRIL